MKKRSEIQSEKAMVLHTLKSISPFSLLSRPSNHDLKDGTLQTMFFESSCEL